LAQPLRPLERVELVRALGQPRNELRSQARAGGDHEVVPVEAPAARQLHGARVGVDADRRLDHEIDVGPEQCALVPHQPPAVRLTEREVLVAGLIGVHPRRVDHRHPHVAAEPLRQEVGDQRSADAAPEDHDPRRHARLTGPFERRSGRTRPRRRSRRGRGPPSGSTPGCPSATPRPTRAPRSRRRPGPRGWRRWATSADRGRACRGHRSSASRLPSSCPSLLQMKVTGPSTFMKSDATPSWSSTSGSRSSIERPSTSIDREHAWIATSPIDLACRNVSLQCCPPCRARMAAPSEPASGATPWSLVIRSDRNASSAQYCRNTFTLRPMAAAPAVRTAAAFSLSSVPENRTRESVWPSTSHPRLGWAVARYAGTERGPSRGSQCPHPAGTFVPFPQDQPLRASGPAGTAQRWLPWQDTPRMAW